MRALAAAVLVVATGCAAAPEHVYGARDRITRPPKGANSPAEAFGMQIKVDAFDGDYFGELVACDRDYVYLHLNAEPQPYAAIPWGRVRRAEIPRGQHGALAGAIWTGAGALSTVSHGIWAPFTATGWAFLGASFALNAGDHEILSGRCPDLYAYSRYPQGLPPQLRAGFWTTAFDGQPRPLHPMTRLPSVPPQPPFSETPMAQPNPGELTPMTPIAPTRPTEPEPPAPDGVIPRTYPQL